MTQQIAVIGLGRFGENLCLDLMEQGAEVLAIDIDQAAVNRIANHVTQAVIADATDERVISDLNLASYHSVVVSMGHDIGAGILAVISLKEAGVKKLWVKSRSGIQAKTLSKLGADAIINPEQMVAKRVSRQLLSTYLFDFVDLGDGLAIYELKICDELVGKTVPELGLPEGVHVLAIKREHLLEASFDAAIPLQPDEILILGGELSQLQNLLDRLT